MNNNNNVLKKDPSYAHFLSRHCVTHLKLAAVRLIDSLSRSIPTWARLTRREDPVFGKTKIPPPPLPEGGGEILFGREIPLPQRA